MTVIVDAVYDHAKRERIKHGMMKVRSQFAVAYPDEGDSMIGMLLGQRVAVKKRTAKLPPKAEKKINPRRVAKPLVARG